MNLRNGALLATLAAFVITLAGCGGGSSSNTPPPPPTVTVSLSGQPASLTTGATASITATVSSGAGVTWTCATSPCGSFSSTTTASGTATVYTAPSAVPASGTVTVTATTSSGTAASASATITITAPAPPPISVAFSPTAPTSLNIGTTSNLTAVVANDTQNKGVTWAVTCSSSSCGSFSPTSTPSGTATVYTAPATVPTSGTVTVTATSVTDTTKTASATITITAPAAITVALNPTPPTSLGLGATANLTAVVTNDAQNKGVTWTVTCGSSSCGSFNPTSTASGAATAYTAPSAFPTAGTVTVIATSVADTTKTASATITIAPITVALNPAAPTSLIVGTTVSLTSVVSNDSQNKGVTWTVTCGSSACGSFSTSSTASGAATVYTAPTTIPTPNTVTITVTSVTDTTKSASATITITPFLADGTYVYHFSGWDSTGPSFFVGAFTVSGGVITGGEQDFSDASIGYALDTLVPANCSLTAVGGNIQIVLGTSNTALGVNGNETLRGTAVSSTRILITEFDTFGTGNGSIDLQTTPVAPPSGGYAFAVSGWDINTSANTVTPLGIGGVLNFNGTSLTIGNSVFDLNLGDYVNGPLIVQAQLFTSGSLNGPDAFGRVSISLAPTQASGVPSFVLTGYVLSPSQIQLVESQADVLNDDLGGMALGQGSNAGTFSLASLSNTTYVFASSGEDVNNLATFGGNLTFGTSGALSGTLAINDLSSFTTTSITSGGYTVDPTGRATVSSILTSQFPNDPFAFQLYLDGNGNALALGIDNLEVTTGPSYLKTAPSNDFEGPYALSGSGIINDTNLDAWGAAGPVAVSSDNLTGAANYNAQELTPVSATPVTATENSSAGTLAVTGLDASSFTSSRLYSYFPIDGKRVFAIEADGAQLGILTLESTSH
ncbi:MAG: hypothetical protein WDN23_11525 [Edaphobacter sp.]